MDVIYQEISYVILLIFGLLINADCVFACFLLFLSVSCIFHYSVLGVRFYNKIKESSLLAALVLAAGI